MTAVIVGALAAVLASRGLRWVVPIVVFVFPNLWMIADSRRPLTAKWVLLAAGVAVAVGVVIRLV